MKEPHIIVNQDILLLIAKIDEFKGRWQALKTRSPGHLQRLRKIATIESIGSSTRIEGAQLTDTQIETLLSNLNATSFKTRDEQEVAGYAETMDLIFQAHEDLHLTENHIQQLHQTLLRHSRKDERHRGSYKTLPNHVIAKNQKGDEIGIVFQTATPFDTPRKMEELIHWTNKALTESTMHPLLITAVFIVVFLAIHPFQDGNGRLSRILTTLLLLRAGYEYVPYTSLEHIIEENKELYYKALRRTQTTLHNNQPDWSPWLGFFLRCLNQQRKQLTEKIQLESSSDNKNLPPLSQALLKSLTQHDRLTINQMTTLTGANKNTIKVRLRELVHAGHIRRHGKGRATWYTL